MGATPEHSHERTATMLVRPTSTFNSTLKEVPNGVVLSPSDILRDDNPHVKARPDHFEEITPSFHGRNGLTSEVEQATAKPGEKRNR